MAQGKISLQIRTTDFWEQFQGVNLRTPQAIVFGLGWFISYVLLALAAQQNDYTFVVLLFLHAFFLFRVVRAIVQHAMPPVELLLLVFWMLFAFDIFILQGASILSTGSESVSSSSG